MFVPFGEYLPDQPEFGNPGSPHILNVLPTASGYESFPEPTQLESAGIGTSPPRGGLSARDTDGTVFNFFGTGDKLHRFTGTAYEDVSRTSGGAYSTGEDERWGFTQFGRQVVACNYADATQAYAMGTSTDFAALSGSPPRARYIAQVREFVVLGNVNDGTAYPARVQWSGQGTSMTWGTDPATLADYQDLDASHGWVKGVVGGEYGVIFQERAVTRMEFVGSPAAFRFDPVETGHGLWIPGSLAKKGQRVVYASEDGFYLFTGTTSQPVGEDKVNRTFLADIDTEYLHRVSACFHPTKPIYLVAYPNSDAQDGRPNVILALNVMTGRWARLDLTDTQPVELLTTIFTAGYTLDGLDAVSSSIDALAYSLDSSLWTGGQRQLVGFKKAGTNNRLVTFDPTSATVLPAVLSTRAVQLNPGRRSTVTRLRPVVQTVDDDAGAVQTVSAYARESMMAAETEANTGALQDNGSAALRSSGHYHRFELTMDHLYRFEHAQGVEVMEMAARGRR